MDTVRKRNFISMILGLVLACVLITILVIQRTLGQGAAGIKQVFESVVIQNDE